MFFARIDDAYDRINILGVKLDFENYRNEKARGLWHRRQGDCDGACEQGIHGGSAGIK